MYRQKTDLAPGAHYVQPPEWLLDGLLAAAPGFDRSLLADAIVPDRIVPLEEFLQRRPDQLDSPARLVYRACSLALVQLLIEGADGAARLTRYIDNLSSASNDPLADLRTSFPELSSSEVEKLWRGRLATFATTHKSQLLTFAETERRLSDALQALPLEDLATRKVSPAQTAALKNLAQRLTLIGTAAHPGLRPVVAGYQQIAELMAAGKRKGLARRLEQLASSRRRLAARMNEIDDYMNWFEATQSKTKSGAFAEYLRTAADKSPEHRRRDALSVYLDAVEQQTRE